MREWTEDEYDTKAERLGWTVEYLKAYLQKEESRKNVPENKKHDHFFNAVIVGDKGVGKSALKLRFSRGIFDEKYRMTIGADFYTRTMSINTDIGLIRVNLYVWETSRQERFDSIRPMIYRGSLGALVIFDLTNPSSFAHLPQWIEEVRSNVKTEIPIILVGNKCDLADQRAISLEEINSFTQDYKLYYMETSAKTGESVGYCFYVLASLMKDSYSDRYHYPPKPPKVQFPIPLKEKDPENEPQIRCIYCGYFIKRPYPKYQICPNCRKPLDINGYVREAVLKRFAAEENRLEFNQKEAEARANWIEDNISHDDQTILLWFKKSKRLSLSRITSLFNQYQNLLDFKDVGKPEIEKILETLISKGYLEVEQVEGNKEYIPTEKFRKNLRFFYKPLKHCTPYDLSLLRGKPLTPPKGLEKREVKALETVSRYINETETKKSLTELLSGKEKGDIIVLVSKYKFETILAYFLGFLFTFLTFWIFGFVLFSLIYDELVFGLGTDFEMRILIIIITIFSIGVGGRLIAFAIYLRYYFIVLNFQGIYYKKIGKSKFISWTEVIKVVGYQRLTEKVVRIHLKTKRKVRFSETKYLFKHKFFELKDVFQTFKFMPCPFIEKN
jgi:Ras-related protein Rab-11A